MASKPADSGLSALPPGPDPHVPVWELTLADEEATLDLARFIADELRPGDVVTPLWWTRGRQDDAGARRDPVADGGPRDGGSQPDLHPDADLRRPALPGRACRFLPHCRPGRTSRKWAGRKPPNPRSTLVEWPDRAEEALAALAARDHPRHDPARTGRRAGRDHGGGPAPSASASPGPARSRPCCCAPAGTRPSARR